MAITDRAVSLHIKKAGQSGGFLLFLTGFLLINQCLFSMPADPGAFDSVQPDGRAIRLHIRGDEWFHWYEDTRGYTVVRDKGRYAYAQLNQNNRLVPTPLTVGRDDPEVGGLQKRIRPPVSVRRAMKPQLLDGTSEATAPQAVPPSGTVKNLVILCMFSDHTLGVHTRDPNDYDILFNQIGGDPALAPTGSVKDLYLENSYGQMMLQSTVVGWVILPNTEAYYANGKDGTGTYPLNAQKMVEDALYLVDPLVDFSQLDDDGDGYIDAIDIIHSGYGAETGGGGGDWIWSHRWSVPFPYWTSSEGVKVKNYHTEPALWGTSGTSIVRFGVIAHETGHFFGLPDLYDTDQSGEGIGSWGMMANSWGFDNTQLHPPHFCVWSKIFLGWVTPTVINAPGIYTIDQVETNPQVYRVDNGYPSGEYMLIENRQPAGIETAIPQGGLCVYHIDDQADYYTEGYPGQAGWPENGNHYRVAVLQADGNYNLEKNQNRGDRYDVYRGGGISSIGPGPGNHPNTDAYQNGTIIVNNNQIHSISAAGATMSFTFGQPPTPPVATDVSETTSPDTPVTVTLDATDEGLPDPPGMLSYIITLLPGHGVLSDLFGGQISSVPYTLLNNGNQAVYTPDSEYTGPDSFQFKTNDGGTVPDGGDSNTAVVSINVQMPPQVIYSATMDTNPNWTYQGDWQWGVPQGSGGEYGEPDPTSGYTNANVVGYNLAGDYVDNIGSTLWATTPAINCNNTTNVMLRFYRWLNVERSTYDHAYIAVSNNGTNWTTVWQNPDSHIQDSAWSLQEIDISAIADNQATVYIRWGIGPTDSSWKYSGWNIDDVEIKGNVLAMPPRTLTVSSTSGGFVSTPGEGTFQYSPAVVVDVNAIPDLHYHFVDWTGTSVTAGKVADPNLAGTTVTMDGDYTLRANFAIDTFTLDYAAGSGGSLTGDTSQVVDYNSNGTAVTAVPDTGYHFVDWSDASIDNPRTDPNVMTNISVIANFAVDTFTLDYAAGSGGSLTGDTSQVVDYNSNGTAVTAVPDTGYHFVDWSDASTDNPRTDLNVTANINVVAGFAINQVVISALLLNRTPIVPLQMCFLEVTVNQIP